MKNSVIAIDAMGGDNAPLEIVKGAVQAISNNKNINIILVGDESKINECLKSETYDNTKIQIINTTEVIENTEVPTKAIKAKKDSSMVVGLNLVKDEKADAFVSAGSTGALLAGSLTIIGRINGIKRPVLGALLPNETGHTLLVDAGANVDCKAEYLQQFAMIGSLYMENVLGIKKPTVGLVNNGSEAGKGCELTKETFYLLSDSDINFIGNVEAREIPSGNCDVVVCDGFVGNVILKLSEGCSKSILNVLKKELLSSTITKIGALLSKKAFANMKKKFDYREVGGAPFLGLKSLVVKAHGSSDAKAIKNAIKQCDLFIQSDLVSKIELAVKKEVI